MTYDTDDARWAAWEARDRAADGAFFVAVRTTHGGPAPAETTRALEASRTLLARHRDQWAARQAHVEEAAASLRAAAEGLGA